MRLKEAWQARQRHPEAPDIVTSEREVSDDLAARLREAAHGIDREALADRAAALREGREVEQRQVAEDAARKRAVDLERQREIERDTHRDRGHGIDR